MPIEFLCSSCGAELRVPDATAPVVLCGNCRARVTVPTPAPTAEAEPAPPLANTADPFPTYSSKSRQRRTPPPPTPLNISPRLWALIAVVVTVLSALGGFATWRLIYPPWRWQTHESAAAGFKVELPAAPLNNIGGRLGVPTIQGAVAEGTVFRRTQYLVLSAEIMNRWRSDEQIIADSFQGSLAAGSPKRSSQGEPFLVHGFPARDLELTTESGETGVIRVIVADTRLYVLAVGGPAVDPRSAEVRRFLDSFEITEPKIVAVGKRKAEAAEAARLRAEAEAQRKEEERRKIEERKAAEKAEAERKRREAESEAEKFRQPDSALSTPDPSELPRLQAYLSFDTAEGGRSPVLPGRQVSLPAGATLGPGVRGKALYLSAQSGGLELPPDFSTAEFVRLPITVAGWVKMRGVDCDLFNAQTKTGWSPLMIELNRGKVRVQVNGGDSRQPYFPGESDYTRMSAALPDDGRWHHIALTWSLERGDSGLYIDGVSAASFRFPPRQSVTPDRIMLGSPYRKGSDTFNKYPLRDVPHPDLPVVAIDEFCVFNRPLTEREIAYLAGKSKTPGTSVTAVRLVPQCAIEPVTGVAFDPERKVVWGISAPGSYWQWEERDYQWSPEKGPPVCLVKYSYPEFKLLGRWALPVLSAGVTPWKPYSAWWPILDAKNNRLFLGISNSSGSAGDLQGHPQGATDRSVYLYRFDLEKLPAFDPAVAPKVLQADASTVKDRTIGHDGLLTIGGIVLSQDAKWLYFTNLSSPKGIGDTEVCRLSTELTGPYEAIPILGHFVWGRGIALSASGTKVRALQGGMESSPSRRGDTGLLEIDAESWKAGKVLPVLGVTWGKWVPHTAFVIHPDGRVFAGGAAGVTATVQGAVRAYEELRPVPLQLPAYMKISGDGRYLFAAEGGTKRNRLVLIDVRPEPELWDALASLDEEPGVRVGGPFDVSPDGKFVVFRSGLVVRLDEGEDALKPLPKRDPSLEPKK